MSLSLGKSKRRRSGRWKRDMEEDPEILAERERKKYANLLVFGYSSRIFDDRQKAVYFEEGKHLIPWNGDPSLLIDRYDCRGHVHSLDGLDAETLPQGPLLRSEDEEERLCNEERYRDLHALQNEKNRRKKAELQRRMETEYLKATAAATVPTRSGSENGFNEDVSVKSANGSYGAVSFSYNTIQPSNSAKSVMNEEKPLTDEKDVTAKATKSHRQEKAFEPRPDFDIPANICLPQFKRINAIIERTAKFVAEKGPQLEVIIKAKQAVNDDFSFLSPADVLFPYYRFIVESIKKGTFRPSSESSSSSSSDSDDDDGGYLHPSLMRSVAPPPPPPPKPPLAAFLVVSQKNIKTVYSSLIQQVQSAASGKHPLQSQSTGPPPEVVAAVDKIAAYVAKNGPYFEEMVRERHGVDDEKFGFVHGYHPYHSLYEESLKRHEDLLRRVAAEQEQARLASLALLSLPPPPPPPLPPTTLPTPYAEVEDSGGIHWQISPPPPSPPPPPPPIQEPLENPRIVELRKKALEASARISEKLRMKERVEEPTPPPPPPPPISPLLKCRSISPTPSVDRASPSLPVTVANASSAPAIVKKKALPCADAPPGSLLELLQSAPIRPDSEEEGRQRKKDKSGSKRSSNKRSRKRHRSSSSSDADQRCDRRSRSRKRTGRR